MNINLVRDKKTGKPKGFCFLCYENQKSTVLAVDNLNGIKACIGPYLKFPAYSFVSRMYNIIRTPLLSGRIQL